MNNKDIRELKNKEDFKNFYLKDAPITFCEECATISYESGSGFLEIAQLENLKQQQRNISGQQTRRKFYSIVLITEGEIEETIGHENYRFEPNTMYFIGESQLHVVERWSDDVKGIYCMFDVDYFLLCIKHQVKLNDFPFFQLGREPFILLSDREMGMMEHLFWKLNSEKCNKTSFNDDLLTRMFLNIILLEAERIYNKQTLQENFSLSRQDQVVAQFQFLVNQYFVEKRQVIEYAEMLNVHPNYLNDLVKEVTGSPASHFIQKQLVQEIKSRLLQTNDTIAMIAYKLHFTDDSYFNRFFKKQTGFTPLQLRKDHRH
ncbi:AraC family transcriptional regulator [Sphingobacterium sp. UT-1RO-CII-1]|uniref:helix-turn-helix domain-containing protein n=1 Tax=Sphingobacterium sp. UT-1RO-CII-1 TaxID=2995225 RepID=UPI00227C8DF1|nr:AraC family transcriptional regulator [Sphingobacterium sp. UT-1RO-CII-1]MCY4779989.1 AraC family transcriptional regulator [Sphingobacterium sp. UT-1RO-CII-1]